MLSWMDRRRRWQSLAWDTIMNGETNWTNGGCSRGKGACGAGSITGTPPALSECPVMMDANVAGEVGTRTSITTPQNWVSSISPFEPKIQLPLSLTAGVLGEFRSKGISCHLIGQ
jgi:hypothetical protein